MSKQQKTHSFSLPVRILACVMAVLVASGIVTYLITLLIQIFS